MADLTFLTREELARHITCNPETGEVLWAAPARGRRVNGVAGSLTRDYRYINLLGSQVALHRVMWFWCNGEWPAGVIDHINGIKDDNRIDNLRAVTSKVNNENRRRPHPRSAAGLLGVSLKRGRWVAQIRHEGRNKYLGSFPSPEDAHAAYVQAKRRLHPGCTL